MESSMYFRNVGVYGCTIAKDNYMKLHFSKFKQFTENELCKKKDEAACNGQCKWRGKDPYAKQEP